MRSLRKFPGERGYRARVLVAAVAGVLVVVTAIGMLFPTELWRVERNGADLTFSINKPETESGGGPVVFEDHFSDGSGKWNLRETAGALVELSGGGLRVVVHDEGVVDFEVRPLGGDIEAIQIEAKATVLAGRGNAVFGIVCAVSAGLDAPSTGGAGAYALLIDPATRLSGIGRTPGALDDGFELSSWLHQGQLDADGQLGRTVLLRGECRGGETDRRISFWVDGRGGGTAVHAAGPARFDGAGVAVFNLSGSPKPDIRFDDVVVRKISP